MQSICFPTGYADQFGGPNGKKFKYDRLKQTLIEIQDHIMYDQKIILEDTIDRWMKGSDGKEIKYDQIDDILIMGIKI